MLRLNYVRKNRRWTLRFSGVGFFLKDLEKLFLNADHAFKALAFLFQPICITIAADCILVVVSVALDHNTNVLRHSRPS